jgi:PAB-dependent poly(A)-specific ribonuclease subunit 2
MAFPYTPLAPIHPELVVGHGIVQPVSALSFDPMSDTLWTGTDTGRIVALHSPRGVRGVSFKVGGRFGVKKLLAGENYVHAMAAELNTGMGSWSKGGANKWYFRLVAVALMIVVKDLGAHVCLRNTI